MIICSVCGFPIMPEVGCPHSIAGVTAKEWREMSPEQRKAAVEHRVQADEGHDRREQEYIPGLGYVQKIKR